MIYKKEENMPNIQKIIQKMKQQPHGIRFEELAKVLESSGYSMKSTKRYIAQKLY